MPELTASAATLAVTGAGITILGISTGLQPDIMLAGFSGGLWAQYSQEPAPLFRRLLATLGASVVAGYMTPFLVAMVRASDALPPDARDMVMMPVAMIVGLLSHKVIGPAILRIAARRIEQEADK
jgi:hypothetical protein